MVLSKGLLVLISCLFTFSTAQAARESKFPLIEGESVTAVDFCYGSMKVSDPRNVGCDVISIFSEYTQGRVQQVLAAADEHILSNRNALSHYFIRISYTDRNYGPTYLTIDCAHFLNAKTKVATYCYAGARKLETYFKSHDMMVVKNSGFHITEFTVLPSELSFKYKILSFFSL